MRGPALFAAALLAVAAHAQMDGSDYVKVTVGDGVIPSEGEALLATVSFELAEGWHIYWKNPGDSGAPPELKWSLPKGMTVGSVRWPAPHRIEAGGLVSYGYEGVVNLLVELNLAPDFPTNKPIQYKLDVDYLVCKDLCLPGSAKLQGSLEFFGVNGLEKILSKYPRPSNPDSVAIKSQGDDLTLTFKLPELPKGEIKGAYFFAARGGTLDHEAPQKWHLDGTNIILQVKRSQYADKPLSKVEGVLVLTWAVSDNGTLATRTTAFEYPSTNSQEKP